MQLWFYRGAYPNFGDELNPWLWPRVLRGVFDADRDTVFLGIGSIIFDRFDRSVKKLVVGAGYGGWCAPPDLRDGSWIVRFVRGPQTAKLLGLEPNLAVADPAVLLRLHAPRPAPIRRRVGFMPHWENIKQRIWGTVCDRAGVMLIDPRQPVDDVLEQLASCELIVSEALHGAIVADAMRIPWVAALPLDRHQRMKWHDWAASLDFELRPYRLFPSSWDEAYGAMACCRTGRGAVRALRAAPGADFLSERLIDAAVWQLIRLTRAQPMLSSDAELDRVVERVLMEVDALNREYEPAMPRAVHAA